MPLQVDYATERTWAQIVGGLRSARLASKRTQDELASGMSVRGRAISEWETGYIQPTLHHLMQWSSKLDRRLTIADRVGDPCRPPLRLRVGETWESFERRRLAFPLRSRRQALGMSQEQLGELVGVSKDSIQRWELARVPPRPIACIVWAQKLGYSLTLQPTDRWERRLDTYAADVHRARTAAARLGDKTPAPAVATNALPDATLPSS